MAPFVHLRVHSAYSLLEGAIKVKELADLCARNGQPAVAVTDTDNLFGAIEIADNFSLVEVEESLANDVIEAMRNASIRGKKVIIRRDRSHE